MVGQAAFSLGLAALVLGLRRALPPSDHRTVGCGLLALASIGTMACAVARNSCEESVPRCEGNTFTTVSDWVHAIGALAGIIGVAGAALVLAAVAAPALVGVLRGDRRRGLRGPVRLASRSLPVGRHRRASPRARTRGLGSRDGHTTHGSR